MALPWLDRWLCRALDQDRVPAPDELRALQLARVRATLAHAVANSPYYRTALHGIRPEHITRLADLAVLPRTPAEALRERPEAFLATSQDEVARAVSVPSSGTSGPGKRVFYSAKDQQRILQFFDWGMRNMLGPGETALVLLPGERPGSVGLLLRAALESFGARAAVLAPGPAIWAPDRAGRFPALEALNAPEVRCIVGAPAHVRTLALHWRSAGNAPGKIRSVLLCWDAVPESLARGVEQSFGCRAFRHWGMVETGLGGAVSCGLSPAPDAVTDAVAGPDGGRNAGMHLREADILVEIADPESGAPLPDGEWGEILVTTLTRRTMPLIRYRTGDLGRLLPGTCACGSPLRRLDARVRRLADAPVLPGGGKLSTLELGEALYALPGLVDFRAELRHGPDSAAPNGAVVTLALDCSLLGDAPRRAAVLEQVRRTVSALPGPARALGHGLRIEPRDAGHDGPVSPGLDKRTLHRTTPSTESEAS